MDPSGFWAAAVEFTPAGEPADRRKGLGKMEAPPLIGEGGGYHEKLLDQHDNRRGIIGRVWGTEYGIVVRTKEQLYELEETE